MATCKVMHEYAGLKDLFTQESVSVFSKKTGDQSSTKSVTKTGYYPICMAGYNVNGEAIIHRMRLASPASGSVTIQYSVECIDSVSLTVYINWMKIT